ncbi:MAG: Gfo/Idh/MocA family oxidoreductase [Planctomycetia bacterium]|nr:Gfo/Idh/MocA family oxidoreductase [Planctomycetia bacterium]
MTALRMAVVGTGALGRHHARILSQLAGIELVAVADSSPRAVAETAERCRTRGVADYRELLGAVDAVVVAVPTFAHRTVAGEFLAAGVDVLVEKPIAGGVNEARELVNLARRHEALLAVGHVERFNPALAAARPFLADPKYLRVERYAPFSFRSTDIGVVHDLMIHDIDLALDLVAVPVADVQAFGVEILTGHEDCAQARLTFSNGAIADLSVNRVSPVVSRSMQVWTSEGCVHIDLAAREVKRYARGTRLKLGAGPLEKAREPGADIEKLKQELFGSYIEVHKPVVTVCDQLTDELLSFTDCVRNRQRPVVSGETALDAMIVAGRVLDQIAAAPWNAASAGRRLAG